MNSRPAAAIPWEQEKRGDGAFGVFTAVRRSLTTRDPSARAAGRSRPGRAQDPYHRLVHLSLEQGRVIGCLIEKQLTTPQQYPLTLNALVAACNQSSNREPVVCYDGGTVQRALASLKDSGLVRFIYPSHGGSAPGTARCSTSSSGLDTEGLGLIAVLLLRGAQTAGELRARTERMASFGGVDAVNSELERLGARAEPLVLRLPRRPGQKEERWVAAAHAGRVNDAETFGGPAARRTPIVHRDPGPPTTILANPPTTPAAQADR